MKKVWKEEAVSPVIATILMVAITVVLAAVLYVMVISMGNTSTDLRSETPLGLVQQDRNSTTLTILVAVAPTTSLIWSTQVSYTHDGVPGPANATVYHPNGTLAATYNDYVWNILDGNNTAFASGMIIQIVAPVVSHGDDMTMSGIRYGLSILKVN